MSTEYRNVTLADDGTVLGERAWDGGPPSPFQASLDLLWIDTATRRSPAAAQEIWAQQDGYGPVGYTPVQGWDWSGIRDSTPRARTAMLRTARRHLPAAELARTLGVDPEPLERVARANYLQG